MQTSNDNTPTHSNASSFCCICIFSALYEPHVGGVETYTKGIANALVKKGHRVIVVTNNTDNALEQESAKGIEIVRLPCSPLLNGRFPLSKKHASGDALWKWLDSQAVDHVVVNTRFYPLSILGLKFARKKGIEPVLIEHGSAHLTLGNPALDIPLNIVEHTMTMLAKHSKPRCFAVSQKASEWLSHFGISSCGEITNAIGADEYLSQASSRDFRAEFNIPNDALLIASAGRFVPEKGVMQLAEAISHLTERHSSEHPSIVAVMAGDGPLLPKVKALACPNVITPGMLNKSDLAALLKQSDYFCLPSRSEGFSTALLEAAACGTAPIATDVGGMKEIAPSNEYGIMLPSMSSNDIATALSKAVSDPEGATERGSKVAKRVRNHFTWDTSANALLAALRN